MAKNKNLNIIRAKHMGFCFGVSGAIKTCQDIDSNHKKYILGMLVHNESVVSELTAQGFITIEEKKIFQNSDFLQKDDVVIIRAHGTTKEIYELLSNSGVKIYDATCIFVTKIRKKLEQYEKKGYNILFIGDKNHPEVRGIVSFGRTVQIFKDLDEFKNANISQDKKYCLLTQTTMNTKILNEIKEYIKKHYTNIELTSRVCGATQDRQEATSLLAKNVDVVFVVGSKKSSNTKKLYDISKKINPNTYLIGSYDDIKRDIGKYQTLLENTDNIGITAGASTPEKIIKNIENNIRGIFNVRKR